VRISRLKTISKPNTLSKNRPLNRSYAELGSAPWVKLLARQAAKIANLVIRDEKKSLPDDRLERGWPAGRGSGANVDESGILKKSGILGDRVGSGAAYFFDPS
jgi:hypothetical protein